MKAYTVTNHNGYDEPSTIVFADTPGQAKSVGQAQLDCNDWLNLSCRRTSWADGMEKLSEDDFLIEELKHGWLYWPDAGNTDPSGTISESDVELIKHYGMSEVVKRFLKEGTLDMLREEFKKV
jgi:hypothetical protein